MQMFTVRALAICVCNVFHVALRSIATITSAWIIINQSILKILLIVDCKSVIKMPKDILFMHQMGVLIILIGLNTSPDFK